MMPAIRLPGWARRSREVRRLTVPQYFAQGGPGSYSTIHPEAVAHNPLPCNVSSRDALPAERGWWGYSFHDVPERTSGETFLATVPCCRVVWYRDETQGGDFFPAVLAGTGDALDMRELRFRPRHAAALRSGAETVRLSQATWIVERVYHNHSHWLTAHLPKLLLLRAMERLDSVLLPRERTPAIDGSLRLLGFDPEAFRTFAPDRFLQVDELTLIGTDRFRPELLRLVGEASGASAVPRGTRRVFISRSRAARRRLLNEEALWPLLRDAGFERVHLEDLPFEQQAALMRETAVLCAPHGAGLTNMLFAPREADIIEFADPGFPNPNFYALASALGHRYWLVAAASHGDCHPLEKDLSCAPAAVADVLRRLPA